jgi:hypothetical protein
MLDRHPDLAVVVDTAPSLDIGAHGNPRGLRGCR